MSSVAEFAGILPLLAALEAYADEFVLIGGWVPQLYRGYAGIQWNGKLSLTTELDAVVQQTVPANGRPPLRSILKEAGLRPRPGTVPGSVWEHRADDSDAIELFTPLPGPIKGSASREISEQAGIAAIALPDLDLVASFVWAMSIPFGEKHIRVRVPTLGAYMATKAMTFAARSTPADTTRSGQKRGKDLLYIYDVMRAGDDVYKMIQRDLDDIAKSGRFANALRKARNSLTLLRGQSPHPALAEAILMVAERDGSSRAVAAADILGSTEDLAELLNEHVST